MSETKKTKCSLSDRGQFRTYAKPLTATINGQAMVLGVKEFSTESLGWCANGRVVVDVNGVPVICQLGLNLTVVGSKELPAA